MLLPSFGILHAIILASVVSHLFFRCCSHGHHILLLPLLAKLTCSASVQHELFLKTVAAGHVHILSIFLEKGMVSSPSNLSILVKCASEKGQVQTLSLLLRNSALLAPNLQENRRAGGFICGRRAFCDSFFVACKNGDVEVAKLLLEHCKNVRDAVNATDGTDVFAPTAMHHACVGGSIDMVRFLISAGALSTTARRSPFARADPPLFLAISHGHFGN